MGVEDEGLSNPDRRVQDLKQAPIQEARENNSGPAQMHYREVGQLLGRVGHDDVSRPDCLTAMRTIRNEPGISEARTTNPETGREVEVVRCDTETLRVHEKDRDATTASPETGTTADGGDGSGPASVS